MRAFEVERAPLDGIPGVAVCGEIDVATAPQLSEELDAAILEASGTFVIDLAAVEFLDSTGLSALLRARAVLGREDRALVVVCPPGPARRVLEVAGMADLFWIHVSRQDAAAALRRPSGEDGW